MGEGFPYNGGMSHRKGDRMKILRVRMFSKRLAIYLAVLVVMNAGLNLLLLLSGNSGEGSLGVPIANLSLMAMLIAILWLFRRQIHRGKVYLTITGRAIYTHSPSLFGREKAKIFLDLGKFTGFFLRQNFWAGEWLWATKIQNGKKVMLFGSTLYEKSGAEIVAILNGPPNPVVATFIADPDPSPSEGNA